MASTFEALKDKSRVDNYLTGVATGGEKRPGQRDKSSRRAARRRQTRALLNEARRKTGAKDRRLVCDPLSDCD